MKFYFVKWNTLQKCDFWRKTPQVKVKFRSKFKPTFVFCLWRHFWQTFTTVANFLYNSPLDRNTRFFISGQVFNESFYENWYKWRVPISKHWNCKIFVKCLVKSVKQGPLYGVIFQSFSKQFQSNISRPNSNKNLYTSSYWHFYKIKSSS